MTRAPLPLADALGLSGLSRGQIGRLFGLDYRNVARWLRTGTVPPHHSEQADRVRAVITEALDTTTADTARAALLDSSSGRSRYHQLLDHVPQRQQIQFPPHTPRDLAS